MALVNFDEINDGCVEEFGDPITLWPGLPKEIEIQAIIYASSVQDQDTPGDVTRLFFPVTALASADQTTPPVVNDKIRIEETTYRVTSVVKNDGGGGVDIIARKVSQLT